MGSRPRQRGDKALKQPVHLDPETVSELVHRIRYVGSPEHKRGLAFTGPPKLKYGNNICPSQLNQEQQGLTKWLQDALSRGWVASPVEGGFPRYIFAKREGKWFQGRLTNLEKGEYKGWPVEESEVPKRFIEESETNE